MVGGSGVVIVYCNQLPCFVYSWYLFGLGLGVFSLSSDHGCLVRNQLHETLFGRAVQNRAACQSTI